MVLSWWQSLQHGEKWKHQQAEVHEGKENEEEEVVMGAAATEVEAVLQMSDKGGKTREKMGKFEGLKCPLKFFFFCQAKSDLGTSGSSRVLALPSCEEPELSWAKLGSLTLPRVCVLSNS